MTKNYWWLTARPKIWSFDQFNVGEEIEYTSKNEKGHKRMVYREAAITNCFMRASDILTVIEFY
ncbi:hypothetical protein EWH99_00080 [Sporolactobacillus sp. THM7-7]|nr:hypothetical protein EWH99_00080 [Sporolactobacillus sp. THM7-7]